MVCVWLVCVCAGNTASIDRQRPGIFFLHTQHWQCVSQHRVCSLPDCSGCQCAFDGKLMRLIIDDCDASPRSLSSRPAPQYPYIQNYHWLLQLVSVNQ